MRKYLAIMLVLLLVLSCGVYIAFQGVMSPRENVTFEKKAEYGDPSFAEGLHLILDRRLLGHLHWITNVDFGEEMVSDTSYSFSQQELPDEWETEYEGLRIFGDSVTNETENKIIQTEIAKLPPNTDAQVQVRVRDYYEFYPLMVDVSLPGLNYSTYWQNEDESVPDPLNLQPILDFFRIPVLEGEYLSLDLHTGSNGGFSMTSSGIGISDEGESFGLFVECAIGEDALFLYFDNRTSRDNRADLSYIPGGYGIYRVNYDGKLDTESIGLFVPLEETTAIRYVSVSSDKQELLLHTVEEGTYYVTVLDAHSGAEEQRFTITNYAEDNSWENVFVDGDITMLQFENGQVCVIVKDADSYRILFNKMGTELERNVTFLPYRSFNSRKMFFDGDRLAICGGSSSDDPYATWSLDNGCGFYAAVYDENGLQYFVNYASSLDDANEDVSQWDMRIKAADKKDNKAFWK